MNVPAPWPIIASVDVALNAGIRQRINKLARQAIKDDPSLTPASFSGAGVRAGWAPFPTLFIEDHRPIELVTEQEAQQFEYRSLGLASDQDFLLISRERDPDFEQHLRHDIGLGSPTILSLGQAGDKSISMCRAGLYNTPLMATLTHTARSAGGMNIMPFQSTIQTWFMARTLALAARVPIWVAGPSPRLSQCSNNKLWFARLTDELLGADALPPTWAACGYAMAAARLRWLARKQNHITLKLPSSAGSRGNLVFDGHTLRNQPLADIRDHLLQQLNQIGWSGGYPLLLSPWEAPVLASPSAQVWIPSSTDGPPIIEGLYTQILSGSTGMFTGAAQADLPAPVIERLAEQAMQLSTLLQAMGYFGRISMDALLIGHSMHTATLHWIESNARWGGVSIPMCITHRLGIVPPNHHSVIAQARVDKPLRSMTALLEASRACRYNTDRKQGVIWFNAPSAERANVFFIAVSATSEGAMNLIHTMEHALNTSIFSD